MKWMLPIIIDRITVTSFGTGTLEGRVETRDSLDLMRLPSILDNRQWCKMARREIRRYPAKYPVDEGWRDWTAVDGPLYKAKLDHFDKWNILQVSISIKPKKPKKAK